MEKAAKVFGPWKCCVVLPISILLALAVVWYVTDMQGGWPVEPMNVDHPIANTFGELVMACDVTTGTWKPGYQHGGTDILADHSGIAGAPHVVNIAKGFLIHYTSNSSNGNLNAVHILAENCEKKYIYSHLDGGTIPDDLKDKHILLSDDQIAQCDIPATAVPVGIGEILGKIEDAYEDDRDHLHFQVEDRDSTVPRPWINGLLEIWPNPDNNLPDPVGVRLVQPGSNPWVELPPGNAPGACTIVKGAVDIIVKVGDRDDAGYAMDAASNVFVYDVRWRACPEGNSSCTTWDGMHLYDRMSNAYVEGVDTDKRFSFRLNLQTQPDAWVSKSAAGKCPTATAAATYMILGGTGGFATWDTTQKNRNGQDRYPNGDYILTVSASGVGGQATETKTPVCVQNP